MSEDTLFMIDYINNAKRVGIIDKVWYNYYINNYSISNGTKSMKMINDIKGFIKEIEKRMDKEVKENKRKAYQARIDKANSFIEDIKNRI